MSPRFGRRRAIPTPPFRPAKLLSCGELEYVDLPHRALQRLLGSTKSILRLHNDPSFRTSAQPLTEPHGHFSTYSSFAIEYTRKRDTRHAESHCGIGYRDQTIREDLILEHLSGMWGIVHSRHSQLLVVVLIVDQYRILLLELKREPPVSAHCHLSLI